MRWVKLATTPRFTGLSAGDSFEGQPIKETTAGAPDMIVGLPDEWDTATVDAKVKQWLAQGLIVDHDEDGLWRDERSGWHPLGMIQPFVTPTAEVGDTYSLVGVETTTQRRGKWGAGILIGHCDTGVDGAHPWFADKWIEGDTGGDDVGHGTFCAGIMVGSQGIASDAGLLTLNVLPGGNGTESGVAQGIRQVADRGAQVINLSLGGGTSTIIDNAVYYARQRGAIVVAAAGNTANAPIGSPQRASDVVVLAVTRERKYTDFTSGTNWNTENRCAVPGEDIVSAAPHGGQTQGSGTSFAAPHVTGILALLLASGFKRDEAMDYLWGHRTANPNHLGLQLAADFGGGQGIDGIGVWMLATDALERLNTARFETRGTNNDEAWDAVGAVADPWTGPLAQILALAEGQLPPTAPPGEDESPPETERSWQAPLPDGASYGQTKWLPGSLGCDLFVKRNTVVVAPCDCVVEEVIHGTGLQGGAEVIVATPEKDWAFRYRHVQPSVQVGQLLQAGETVGKVYDSSLFALGKVPAWFQADDDYQHLDWSVNAGTDRFSPQGGGGGNISAYDWLQTLGYQGSVYGRTPGPPDAQHPFESYEALALAQQDEPKAKRKKHHSDD